MSRLIAIFAAGAFFWSFMEYAIHHWVFHLGRGRNFGSREHLEHHARPTYFSPVWMKVGFALPVLLAIFAGLTIVLAVAAADAGAFTFGVAVGWTIYEVLHYRAHVAPPLTRYGAWVRKNHFHHHFVAPAMNHGVTMALWDRVFRTHVPATGKIPVPAKHVHALAWVLGEDGAIAPAFAADYELVRISAEITAETQPHARS